MTQNPFDENRPLDTLLPSLRVAEKLEGRESGPAVNPSVLEVELEDGYEWVYAAWADPGGANALRRELERLMAVTLMLHLSTPPKFVDSREFRTMRLMVFAPVDESVAEAMQTLGFRESSFEAQRYQGRILSLHEIAREAGWEIPGRPESMWDAQITRPDAVLTRAMQAINSTIAEEMGDRLWGGEPGLASKLLAEQIRARFGTQIEPTREGLKQLDVLLVDHTPGTIRWMPPMIFQALCDFVGVVIQNDLGRQVGWAESKFDDVEQPQPPFLQVESPEGPKLLPIGIKMTRWLAMPLLPGLAEQLLDARVDEAIQDLR